MTCSGSATGSCADTDLQLSFFSGHASTTGAISATATYLAFVRSGPRQARPWITLGVGLALTAFVSYERVRSGKTSRPTSSWARWLVPRSACSSPTSITAPTFRRRAIAPPRSGSAFNPAPTGPARSPRGSVRGDALEDPKGRGTRSASRKFFALAAGCAATPARPFAWMPVTAAEAATGIDVLLLVDARRAQWVERQTGPDRTWASLSPPPFERAEHVTPNSARRGATGQPARSRVSWSGRIGWTAPASSAGARAVMTKTVTIAGSVILATAIGLGLFLRPRPTGQEHLAAPRRFRRWRGRR